MPYSTCRCDYIAQWEYPLYTNYLQFVVRSKKLDNWVGIAFKHSGVRPLSFTDKC